MKIVRFEKLRSETLRKIQNRGRLELEDVESDVRAVTDSVKSCGDEALFEFTQKFDGVKLSKSTVRATHDDIDLAYDIVRPIEVKALKKAASNIERFHRTQLQRIGFERSRDGIRLGVITRPLSRVGIYAPGGKTSYPSSVLMCAIPARVAGVDRIVLCSPPSSNGKFSPYILVASDIAQVDEIFCVGGAQAIAAMAYGTETIKAVEKIVGPGNIYVTAAKRLISRQVAIDLPAGPSEILIIADDSAKARFIAADLLAQAEHDENASCILLTNSTRIAQEVQGKIEELLKKTSKNEVSRRALEDKGLIVIVRDLQEATTMANQIGPEHLVVMSRRPTSLVKEIRNAGAIFLGQYSPVALGDYSVGTNHVLPTGGYARVYSGLSVRDFLKMISYVNCSRRGLKSLAETTVTLADIEQLGGHSRSVRVRGVIDSTSEDNAQQARLS